MSLVFYVTSKDDLRDTVRALDTEYSSEKPLPKLPALYKEEGKADAIIACKHKIKDYGAERPLCSICGAKWSRKEHGFAPLNDVAKKDKKYREKGLI